MEHNQSSYYKDPYPTTNTGDYDNAFKFNGKELDDATGMYYYGARYYDPRISIFVSVDLLAEDFAGWTPYHYVHNNPINLIDPTGMSADSLKIANTDQTKLYLNSS
ncbi:MAG TPA: RHS repeat-associated core domain-containing protein, partial [Chitinophagaceae bacterium]|nr:RHS repeat-associated core domain-containing protein [Chitinophagaceae bacterium]